MTLTQRLTEYVRACSTGWWMTKIKKPPHQVTGRLWFSQFLELKPSDDDATPSRLGPAVRAWLWRVRESRR